MSAIPPANIFILFMQFCSKNRTQKNLHEKKLRCADPPPAKNPRYGPNYLLLISRMIVFSFYPDFNFRDFMKYPTRNPSSLGSKF